MNDLLAHDQVVGQLEEAVLDLADDRSRFLAFQRTTKALPSASVGEVLLRWAAQLDEGREPGTRVVETMGAIPSVFSVSAELHQVVLTIGSEGLRRLAAAE